MDIIDLFEYKNWVVVGDVSNTKKYAHKILNAFKSANFTVSGIDSRNTDGSVATSIKNVSQAIDVIDLCISPKQGIKVVKEAKEMNINKVLIQPGAESEEILNFCKENGIEAIEGCALVQLSVKYGVNVKG